MTTKPQPAFEIPGIQIIRMNSGDLARFQGLLDGFQQNVPQSAQPKA